MYFRSISEGGIGGYELKGGGRRLFMSRYGFLREIRVRIRRQVIEDVSEDQISNSGRESEGL